MNFKLASVSGENGKRWEVLQNKPVDNLTPGLECSIRF